MGDGFEKTSIFLDFSFPNSFFCIFVVVSFLQLPRGVLVRKRMGFDNKSNSGSKYSISDD